MKVIATLCATLVAGVSLVALATVQASTSPMENSGRASAEQFLAQSSQQCRTSCRAVYDHCMATCITVPEAYRDSCRSDCMSRFNVCSRTC